jgi:methylmalonyl-CoA/ethylmalonyl-CoA epimerase
MIGNLNYIAIAVLDLDLAVQHYQALLGAFVTSPQEATSEGIRFATVKLPNTLIKLMAAVGENSPLKDFLTKNPQGGVHHICYEVPNLEEAKAQLMASGIQIFENSIPLLDSRPTLIFGSQNAFGVVIAFQEKAAPNFKGRVEIERVGTVHTPHLSSDSLKGVEGIGIGIEVDFHRKTPSDNLESE